MTKEERATPPSQDEDEDTEAEVHGLMRDILAEQGADEYWPRMYDENSPALPQVSRLKAREVRDRVAALWFADTFGQEWIKTLITKDLALRGSIDGQGRKEAVTAYTGVVEQKARGMQRVRDFLRGEG